MNGQRVKKIKKIVKKKHDEMKVAALVEFINYFYSQNLYRRFKLCWRLLWMKIKV